MNKYYIRYKDEDEKLAADLINSFSNKSEEEILEFYTQLNNIIYGIVDEKIYDELHKLVFTGEVKFKQIYDILKNANKANKYNYEFKYIEKYMDEEFDSFMFLNYLVCIAKDRY